MDEVTIIFMVIDEIAAASRMNRHKTGPTSDLAFQRLGHGFDSSVLAGAS